MATIHVWSGATGAADGTSWTDAFTTLEAGFSAWTTSDVIYIHAGSTTPHREEFTSAEKEYVPGGNEDNLVPVYAVDKDNSDAAITDPETPGAPLIEASTSADPDLKFDSTGGGFAFFGLWVRAGKELWMRGRDAPVFLENCRLDTGFESTSGRLNMEEERTYSEFRGCDIYLGDSVGTTGGADVTTNFGRFVDCRFFGNGLRGGDFLATVQRRFVEFIACDFSSAPFSAGDNLVNLSSDDHHGHNIFNTCKIPSTFNVSVSAGLFTKTQLNNCDDGSGSFYRTEHYFTWGDVKTDSGVYLDWSDETGATTGTSLSHKITPNSGCKEHQPISGIPMISYIGSTGSKTFTVESVENYTTALQDDEAWMEIVYHGVSGEVVRTTETTRVVKGDTPSNLTAGTGLANWTGEPAGSRSVKFASTVTVNNVGYYEVRIYLAKHESGKVLHYDPAVSVT